MIKEGNEMYAFIADVHIGVNLKNEDFMNSLDMLFKIIHDHKEPCHCIFVCGDLFDHRLNIDEYKFATKFLLKLVCNNLSREPGVSHIPVHFIKGTDSHDCGQYDIFIPMLYGLNRGVYYAKTNSEYVNESGHRILYLPQLYGDTKYDEYFSKSYDIIVGHGPMSSSTMSPCKCANYEILMSADQLGSISKICVFGHYHGYTDFGNNVFYAGPLLRWQFGQPEKRVFTICDDNFNMETYDNPYAIEYRKENISDIETLREQVSEGISTPVRFVINANENTNMEEYYAIMNMTKNNKNISYQINTIPSIDAEVDNQTCENVDNTETIVSNDIVDPVDSLIQYISDNYETDTEKEIHDYESKIKQE